MRHLQRLFHIGQGFGILASLIQDPCQTVEVRRIVGIGLHGLLNHLLGLLELLALVSVQVTQIVVDSRIMRIDRIHFFQDDFTLANVAHLNVDVRQAESRLFDQHAQMFERFEIGNQLLVELNGLLILCRMVVNPRFLKAEQRLLVRVSLLGLGGHV